MSTCWLCTAGWFDEDATDFKFAEMKIIHYYTSDMTCPGMFTIEMGLGSWAQKVKLFLWNSEVVSILASVMKDVNQ